jgi:hypothetical protein
MVDVRQYTEQLNPNDSLSFKNKTVYLRQQQTNSITNVVKRRKNEDGEDDGCWCPEMSS